MGKWENVSAGPRQVKDFNHAAGKMQSEGRTHTELYGVVGGKESSSALVSMMSPVRDEVAKIMDAIGDRFGWQVTKTNVKEIVAAFDDAMVEARTSRPVVDNRRTADEEAVRVAEAAKRQAEYNAKQAAKDAVMAAVMAKAPSGAKGIIYAEYCVDASDIYTDYFASHAKRVVAIGWRFTARENFKALAEAARQFPETANVEFTEHRDNHSMGAGNYLSDHGWAGSGTGWLIKSRTFPCKWLDLTEDAIPQTVAKPATSAGQAPSQADASKAASGITVSPGSKPGFVELRFPDKPAASVRTGMKRNGFRWSPGNGCWYGRNADYAERVKNGTA